MTESHPPGYAPSSTGRSSARKTFCCCIPSRLGVLCFSPVVAALAILLFFTEVKILVERPFKETRATALMALLVTLSGLLILAAIFGWLGALLRRRGMVAIYEALLWLNWVSLVAIGIATLVVQWKHHGDVEKRCVRNALASYPASADAESLISMAQKLCNGTWRYVYGLSTTLYLVAMAVLLWLALIVTKYSNQLKLEKLHDIAQAASSGAPSSREGSTTTLGGPYAYGGAEPASLGARGFPRYVQSPAPPPLPSTTTASKA